MARRRAKEAEQVSELPAEQDKEQLRKRPREVVSGPSVPSYYSNSIDLGVSASEFRIRLGEVMEANAEKIVVKHLATLWLSPAHAKEIAKLLTDHVTQYEEKYGPIKST